MDEAPKESLEAIKKRERDALYTAFLNTTGRNYNRLHSGINEYDEHLFPGTGSVFEKIRAIHAAHPDRPVRILDFGCGGGKALRELKEKLSDIPLELTGISVGDVRDAYEQAKDTELGIEFNVITLGKDQKPKATFVADADKRYDLILTRFTLQHIPDIFRTLRGLYQSLEPDGSLHAHIGQFTLAERFADMRQNIPDDEEIAGAEADFIATVDDLIEQGVQIEKHPARKPAVLVIQKSKTQMKFPNLAYSLDGTSTGRVYRRTV